MNSVDSSVESVGRKQDWLPGEVAWFEYHCYEGHDSADAQAWYRSHQQVTVLRVSEPGPEGTTAEERDEAGWSRCYRVRFADGLEWDVFEDELLTGSEHFYCADPPAIP